MSHPPTPASPGTGPSARGRPARTYDSSGSGSPGTPVFGGELTIDGEFGPATRAAAQCFHAAYGLEADGIAGPLTFGKICELQKGDCSPVNFDWSELDQCGTDWSGGQVDAGTVQANVLVTMWKLQALRHAMGDRPIGINDGSATTPATTPSAAPRHPPHVRPRRRHERRLPGLLCPGP